MEHEPAGQRHAAGAAGSGGGRGGEAAPSPLRAAAIMVAVGVVLAAAGLLVGDERWQLVALIVGGMTGAVGLLTLGYSRIERNVPLQRPPWRG